MLIWTNFDSFAITYVIQVDCFKEFLANTKGSGTSFQIEFFVEFFDEIICFGI